MDVKSGSSDNLPSTTASNFCDFLTNPGEVDCCLLPTSWITLSPQDGEGPTIPTRTGEDVSTIPIALQIYPGVITLARIIITCRRVLLIHTLPDAASAMTSLVAGVRSVCGANMIGAIHWSIPGFVVGGKAVMVRQLKNIVQYSIASVSNCFRIACKIALCVTQGRCV